MTTEPYYNANGHWMPSIPNQKCGQCGVTYTAHSKTQKFCSIVCKGAHKSASRRALWPSKVCPGCDQEFKYPPYEPTIFCSKECRFESGAWKKPVELECATCGSVFTERYKDAWQERRYCSDKCRHAGLRTSDEIECANCGTTFLRQPCRDDTTCSKECRREYWNGSRAYWTWKGGIYQQGDRKRIRLQRPGYVTPYEGEHRIIAGRAIGRPIMRGEVVIHLDNDHTNNVEFNLFVCGSNSEMKRRFNGSLPWPTHSNLDTYGRAGYRAADAGLRPLRRKRASAA